RFSRDWSSDVCSSDLDPVADSEHPVQTAKRAGPHLYFHFPRPLRREVYLGSRGGHVFGTTCRACAKRRSLQESRAPIHAGLAIRSEERRVGQECRKSV